MKEVSGFLLLSSFKDDTMMVFMFNVLMMDYLRSCTCFDVGSGMHMFWSRVLSCSFIFDIMFLSLVFQLQDCIVVFFFFGAFAFCPVISSGRLCFAL